MNRKATLLVIAVFLLGAALGGVSTHLVADRVWGSRVEGKGGHDKGRNARARVVDELTRDLALTPEQQKLLEAVLQDTWGRYQAIYDQMQPQFDQIRQQGRERIRAFLTPEQRPKFEEFVRRIDEQRKKKSSH